MARNLETTTLKVLKAISQTPNVTISELFDQFSRTKNYKAFYNLIYRLVAGGYAEKQTSETGLALSITPAGKELLTLLNPKKDGVWKIVIFDIKEKQKKVRAILRSQLKRLHFKKWQNSIWISPYTLPQTVEEELKELAKKYFVRLIKTTEINETADLEKMFE
jgi:hypothetical protein